MKPQIPLHDPRFKYVDSANSNIRVRFDAIRRELKRTDPQQQADSARIHDARPDLQQSEQEQYELDANLTGGNYATHS